MQLFLVDKVGKYTYYFARMSKTGRTIYGQTNKMQTGFEAAPGALFQAQGHPHAGADRGVSDR